MRDITKNITSYLEAKRHLWNTHFINHVQSIRECSPLDEYEEIDKLLFMALVLKDINQTLPPGFLYGKDPVSFLKVIPKSGIGRLSVMITDPLVSSFIKWNAPIEIEINPGVEFTFIELFDWDRYDFASYPYYLSRISKSIDQPDIVGRNILIDTSQAKIYYVE